ncbi:MAG: DUF2505 domain-containing protein [Actinomycetota bacterium]
MDFEIAHRFDAHPDEVAQAMLDEEYQDSLSSLGRLQRELLEQTTQKNGRVVRRTRCVLDVDISGVASGFIGDRDPAWVERAVWHHDDMRWNFTIDPEIARELLEADGVIKLSGDGHGTLRTVEGRVRVKVPFYGGRVESWIVKGLTDAYDEEAERLRAWIGA